MHSNVAIKNVSWPHFSWATLYVVIWLFLYAFLFLASRPYNGVQQHIINMHNIVYLVCICPSLRLMA